MKILFRASSSASIGMGHLQRCLSLADALRRFGAESVFLLADHLPSLRRVGDFGFKCASLESSQWGREETRETIMVAAHNGCNVVVVDSHDADLDYFCSLKKADLCLVSIDDFALFPTPAHLLVNPGAHSQSLCYRSMDGDTTFLLGARYALLRPEFWEMPSRVPSKSVSNILVTLGGADPYEVMPSLLRCLNDIPWNFSITAVIGPFFENTNAIEHAAMQCKKKEVRLVHSPVSVRDLMLTADLAVSAGGQTLYELAATGTPVVAIEIADNQRPQMEVLAEYGVISSIHEINRGNIADRVKSLVEFLLVQPEGLNAMSFAGRNLVDGRGAMRVAKEIWNKIGAM